MSLTVIEVISYVIAATSFATLSICIADRFYDEVNAAADFVVATYCKLVGRDGEPQP